MSFGKGLNNLVSHDINFNSFPKQQILDTSKLKEFADDHFNSDENGRKFFKQVENTVGKGEIAQLGEG